MNPIRMLMIEGVTLDKAIILDMLRGDNHTTFDCEHVSTLAAACNQLQGNAFDCLLVGMNLPDSKGLSTVRRVQAASAAPVVVLTDFDDPAAAEAALAIGVRGNLTKGRFNRRRLASTILHAVERKSTGFDAQVLNHAPGAFELVPT